MARTKSDIVKFVTFFRDLGFDASHIGRETTIDLKRSWQDVFVANQFIGRRPQDACKVAWEAFSLNMAAYVQGKDAVSRYKRHGIGTYRIWTEQDRLGALLFSNQRVPPYELLNGGYARLSFLGDLFVTSVLLDWTLVLTHERESGIGPYYAAASWQRNRKPGPLTIGKSTTPD